MRYYILIIIINPQVQKCAQSSHHHTHDPLVGRQAARACVRVCKMWAVLVGGGPAASATRRQKNFPPAPARSVQKAKGR